MMTLKTSFLVRCVCSLVALALNCHDAPSQDLNTTLMNSTVEIGGPSTTIGQSTTGTVFFMGKPKIGSLTEGYIVLITAGHVLDEISGDDATLLLRRQDAKGVFGKFPYPIKIRKKGVNLYVKNSDADVAAMYVALPPDINRAFLPIQLLADDATLEHVKIHPGDELFCLGFPLIVDLNGFPVLRTGILASYPITPSKTVKQYFIAFHVFPGNSGGPVYFSYINRTSANGASVEMQMGVQQGVIGLVSQRLSSPVPEYKDLPLDVAAVVPSSYIQETIALLSASPPNP